MYFGTWYALNQQNIYFWTIRRSFLLLSTQLPIVFDSLIIDRYQHGLSTHICLIKKKQKKLIADALFKLIIALKEMYRRTDARTVMGINMETVATKRIFHHFIF